MKHRTTHVLLAVAVALLGLDLALRVSPQEAAGQELEWRVEAEQLVPDPHVVAWTFEEIPLQGYSGPTEPVVVRLWSDGVMDAARWNLGSVRQIDPPCAADPFGDQPCHSEWVVLQEGTP